MIMDWTAIGTVVTVLGGVWGIVTYKTNALEHRMDKLEEKMDKHEQKTFAMVLAQDEKIEHRMNIHEEKMFAMLVAQDEKIFQLATGKSLREAMMEAKKAKEK